MDKQNLERQAKNYFLPFILGNNRGARALAAKVFRAHHIVSFILEDRRSVRSLFNLSYYFVPLTPTDSSRLLCEQLISYAKQNPFTLPLLVPMTPYYKDAVEQNRELLERYFIIRGSDSLLSSTPLTTIR